jgi:hypothetical protein
MRSSRALAVKLDFRIRHFRPRVVEAAMGITEGSGFIRREGEPRTFFTLRATQLLDNVVAIRRMAYDLQSFHLCVAGQGMRHFTGWRKDQKLLVMRGDLLRFPFSRLSPTSRGYPCSLVSPSLSILHFFPP